MIKTLKLTLYCDSTTTAYWNVPTSHNQTNRLLGHFSIKCRETKTKLQEHNKTISTSSTRNLPQAQENDWPIVYHVISWEGGVDNQLKTAPMLKVML